MDEIKFRGWCDQDSGWVYGSYVHDNEYHEIATLMDNGTLYASQISRKSLGQFTGLQDSKGTDIYGGDVIYLAGYGHYVCEFPFIELYHALSEGDIGEILGNIYDDPELGGRI